MWSCCPKYKFCFVQFRCKICNLRNFLLVGRFFSVLKNWHFQLCQRVLRLDIDLSTFNIWQNENFSGSICDDHDCSSKLQWYGISISIEFQNLAKWKLFRFYLRWSWLYTATKDSICGVMMKMAFLDSNQRLHLNLFDEYVKFYQILYICAFLYQVLFGSQNSNWRGCWCIKTLPQAKRRLSTLLWLSWLSSLDNFHP